MRSQFGRAAFAACIACAASAAVAQFSTMREAMLVAEWFDRFEPIHKECQQHYGKDPAAQPDIPKFVQTMREICSSTRLSRPPIPEDIPVDVYRQLRAGRDCLIELPAKLAEGMENRLRVDAIPNLREGERQVLRKQFGDPIAKTLERCQTPLDQFGGVTKAARKATAR